MSVKVGIIMGSDSDLPVMSKAAEILDELQVPYELTIVSAHRTPDRLCEYAKTAEEKGLCLHRYTNNREHRHSRSHPRKMGCPAGTCNNH